MPKPADAENVRELAKAIAKPLTPEQLERREVIRRRTEGMKNLKPPKSGIFGGKPKEARR